MPKRHNRKLCARSACLRRHWGAEPCPANHGKSNVPEWFGVTREDQQKRRMEGPNGGKQVGCVQNGEKGLLQDWTGGCRSSSARDHSSLTGCGKQIYMTGQPCRRRGKGGCVRGIFLYKGRAKFASSECVRQAERLWSEQQPRRLATRATLNRCAQSHGVQSESWCWSCLHRGSFTCVVCSVAQTSSILPDSPFRNGHQSIRER